MLVMTPSENKLKGGDFVIRDTDPATVFTPESWNEEQMMMAQAMTEFIEQEYQPLGIMGVAELDAEKDRDFIVGMLERAGEMGFCGMSIEEKYGGIDLDFNTSLLVGEALAKGLSFGTTLGAQTSIGSLPIVFYGTDAQKEKYLPGIASGELKAAYALTEPGSGSDANSGRTKAVPTPDGKTYILNGQKMWITNGGFADVFIVFAKIEDDKNLSAFIVERDFGGVTTGKEEKKMGIKASSTVQVFFSDTPVPAENLLSERGAGFKIALNILNTGRIKLAAGAVGGAKMAMEQGIPYAIERKQFDTPIAEFGAIKHKIGEMTEQTFAMESAVFRTGYNIDQKFNEFVKAGLTPNEAKVKSVREYAVECALLKVQGSESVSYVVDEVLQIFGGMG
ncbi:MAG: acyl-CoA dehydrogenase family protein, partial [Bacteroidota bacterium]